MIRDTDKTLGEAIAWLKSIPGNSKDEGAAIAYDAVSIRGDKPSIVTGADVLGKRLKGIAAPGPA